ncbi:hypothetical protein ACTNEO_05065 [Gracilibacillus sp. HCP3S3_G5_1]|uniref:hypothetical protein n=1 Tax=unclassified Gracilibacillus TaxID=2625209 RepID=UPI003F8C822D
MDKKYGELEFLPGSTIDHVVNELLSYREKGKLAAAKFNGVTLYSDTVTLDLAYLEITGMTKAEFDTQYRSLDK